MPDVRANGLSFHVQLMGAGPPLAMLHGLIVGNLAGWYFTAAPALAQSHRVLLYDLRGHGRSERPPSGYRLANMVADLEALIEAHSLGDAPWTLVGHSYGALVALAFAGRHPERVARLALVEPLLEPAVITSGRQDSEEILAALPEPLRAALGAGGRRVRAFLASLEALLRGTTLLADVALEPPLPDGLLGAIHCPVLALFGRESFLEGARGRFEREVPSARIELLPGGHLLHLERAAEVTALLQEFLHG